MAVTDPSTSKKKKDTSGGAGAGATTTTTPSASAIVDILKTSDHSKQQEQAVAAAAAAEAEATSVLSPARTTETMSSEDYDDDIEQGKTPTSAVSSARVNHTTTTTPTDARSVSSVSTGSSNGRKKRAAVAKTFIKSIVPKAVRKQGRRLFDVVKHASSGAAAATTAAAHDDNNDANNDHYYSSDDDAAIAATIAAVAATNNETTPLLGASNNVQAPRSSSSLKMGSGSSTLSPEKKARAAAAWKRLAVKVKSGEFLLETTMGSFDGNCNNSNNNNDDDDENEDEHADLSLERLKAQEAIQSGLEFSVWQCLVAMILYMGIAILAFKFFLEPSWTVIDSMYFAMVTFTTIGYGDLSPHNHLGRVFTVIFALSGVACLGIALGVLGNSVIEAQNQAAEKTKELAEKRVISIFSSDDDDDDDSENRGDAGDAAAVQKESKEKEQKQPKEEVKEQHPILQIAKEFAFVFIILIVFACLMADDPGVGDTENWDIVNAMYYAIITASTVGYGDFAPKTQRGRLIAMIYIPLAVGAMGHFLGMLASVIMDAKQDSFRREMQSKELTYHDLEIMDADGSGAVSQTEFIEFMLIAMKKVDKEFLEELRAHFNRLDTDGTGYLCKGDLIHNARKKLRTSAKKMELKAYKEKLLAQLAEGKRQRNRVIGIGPRTQHKKKRASFFQFV